MNYSIAVEKEKIYRPDIKLYTGNIRTYTFSFDFDENWKNLIKFASFSKNNEAYIIEIIDNMVSIPHEILQEPGICSFGIDIDDETTYLEGSEFYTLRNSKLNWTFNYV